MAYADYSPLQGTIGYIISILIQWGSLYFLYRVTHNKLAIYLANTIITLILLDALCWYTNFVMPPIAFPYHHGEQVTIFSILQLIIGTAGIAYIFIKSIHDQNKLRRMVEEVNQSMATGQLNVQGSEEINKKFIDDIISQVGQLKSRITLATIDDSVIFNDTKLELPQVKCLYIGYSYESNRFELTTKELDGYCPLVYWTVNGARIPKNVHLQHQLDSIITDMKMRELGYDMMVNHMNGIIKVELNPWHKN